MIYYTILCHRTLHHFTKLQPAALRWDHWQNSGPRKPCWQKTCWQIYARGLHGYVGASAPVAPPRKYGFRSPEQQTNDDRTMAKLPEFEST